MTASQPWPWCPRPQREESLPSWFERVGQAYQMSSASLLSSLGSSPQISKDTERYSLRRLLDPDIKARLIQLARLPDGVSKELWPATTGWELRDCAFRVYCPYCCLADLRAGSAAYGRRDWQQSWYTICRDHGIALVLRPTHQASHEWSAARLRAVANELGPPPPYRFRQCKVKRDMTLHARILGTLAEIVHTTTAALCGEPPNPLLWGPLSASEFLQVLADVTTWSLTHFEPVRAWSVAEDFTPLEKQEGYGLIGRQHRQCASDYPLDRAGVLKLQDVTEPKIRGSALWVAHALMCASHQGSTDRTAGSTLHERQVQRLRACAPVARAWLGARRQAWPEPYRRRWWIDPENDTTCSPPGRVSSVSP